MEITAEIACYPLQDNYKALIIPFIQRLNKYEGIDVQSTGMNTTLITGDSKVIFNILEKEIISFLKENKGVFTLKIAKGNRTGIRKYD